MTKKHLLLAVAAVLILCCIGSVLIVMLSPEATTTPAPKAISASTALPPNTPVPTNTPLPLAPSFEEIRTKHDAMTDAQWKNYRTQIEGTMVVGWQGWIDEVTGKPGRYRAMIDMDPPDDPLSYPEVKFTVPDDLALNLSIDQAVTFSGKISSVMDVLGALDITLEQAELQ
jgi:hypothetical protein